MTQPSRQPAGDWRLVGGVLLLGLGAWELAGRAGLLSLLYFPPPSRTLQTLWRFMDGGVLMVHLAATLKRLFTGFLLGAVPAALLGLLMGWSPRLRVALDPLIAATHPLPKIALFPLIIIIFGLGEVSNVLVIALGAFFPMLINAMAAVRQISPVHFEVAQNYGAGPLTVFTRVIIPGSVPLLITGARLALNVALLLTITVELLIGQDGLGVLLWLARETLRTEEVYACLLLIAIFGAASNLLLQRLGAWLAPWQAEHGT